MKLYCQTHGSGRPIVFLHGLAASGRFWRPVIDRLPAGYQSITVDLLGFGRSPKPKLAYTLDQHVDALEQSLATVDQPFLLVGHSMGALLAVAYARRHPQVVSGLVMVSMPVFSGPAEARRVLTGSRLRSELFLYGLTSRLLCAVACQVLRPLTAQLVRWSTGLPADIASDTLRHTWGSYAGSRDHVIGDSAAIVAGLSKLKIPKLLLQGTQDPLLVPANIQPIAQAGVKLIRVNTGHRLPLERPDEVVNTIQDLALGGKVRGRQREI